MDNGFGIGSIINILAILSLMQPLYILSVIYTRKKKYLIGGSLACSKLLLLIRFSGIWEEMLKNSGKAGWRAFGFGYSPILAIMLMSMIAFGVVCTAVNVCAFCKQKKDVNLAVQA